ncbi:putative sigma-54 modulation protein [Clostridium cavendishii DSM 21758]|uniref:Ribosome hibernation promoting factor n=1 Tax=Clostridium cavendishii DSM 21758 TaxID=1121302 RepID=A0A1M6H1Q4_9CLOT|nr:ribosome-associated translation inhibitor RaiA [Clostridium cavendishii]SHJ16119.1 putative sigma-54 modulation protein [Clostridium cavendishii DSM 21758]
MQVTVYGKNIEVTPTLRETVERKISKFGKYFTPNVQAKATLSVQKNRQTIEVTIPFNGVVLRGEETTDDMYKSIDLVENKLERQIRKQKTKLAKRNNYDSLRFPSVTEAQVVDEEVNEGKIVKTKRFDVKPMSADEAVLQMELVGHNFFVFQDSETNQMNVVYKRKDGHYGLIEPEMK